MIKREVKKLTRVRTPSAKSDDQPATRKMLNLTRKELIHRMDAGFDRVDSRFKGIDSRFEKMEATLARMAFQFEEQNANNRIVLEGLQALWQRQDKLEARYNTRATP